MRPKSLPPSRKIPQSDFTEKPETRSWLAGPSLSVLGLKFLQFVATSLPIDTASRLGGRIGVTAGPRTRRHTRALANIERAFPGLSPEHRDRIALGMWDNFGRVIAESFVIDKLALGQDRVLFEGVDEIREINGRGRGVIFVGLHFGNWEVTVVPALRLALNPVALYKPLKDSKADAFLRDLRRDLYPSGLLEASPASLLQVTRHLRAGGSICMLADYRDVTGPKVPFFGLPAPSSALAARLHARYGIPIVAARVDRLEGARFRVVIEEVIPDPALAADTDPVVATTAATQKIFERWITNAPEQWIWFYNRW